MKRSLEIIAADEREALQGAEHIASLMGLEFWLGRGPKPKTSHVQNRGNSVDVFSRDAFKPILEKCKDM